MNNQPKLIDKILLAPASIKSKALRLDKYLSLNLKDISRTRIKVLIQTNQVNLKNRFSPQIIVDPTYMVKSGDQFEISIPEAEEAIPNPENIPLNIIFEDKHLIVIEKPPGLVVHPAAGNESGTLVNALLHHCGDSLSGIGGVKRPGIVHRIDKDTSGLMIAAKNDKAHHGLSEQFADHSIERAYFAIVKGSLNPKEGRIEGHIARHPQNRKKMAISEQKKGKWAATNYKSLETFFVGGKPIASLVECRLETGRTHQVRVHMAHIGNPLIGDPVYARPLSQAAVGNKELWVKLKTFKRQALHAAILGFTHPITDKRLVFKSDLPNDMAAVIQSLKNP